MDVSIVFERNPWRADRDAIKSDDLVREALSKKHKMFYSFEDNSNSIFIGPRRAGKTTFFKLLIYDLLLNKKTDPKDVLFVSCEILKDHSDILEILRLVDSKYVFLDEITFVEGWEKAVKFALDQGLLKGRVLYITGSSTAFLRKETFPGRKIKFREFPPLDFFRFAKTFGSEELGKTLEKTPEPEDLLVHFSEISGLFAKYLECGGFPKPAFDLMEEGHINEENYDEIYSWYRGDMLKLGKSEEISKALVSRLLETQASLVAYHSLGNYIGISHRIVREYIETLQALMYAGLCYQADPGKKMPEFRKEKKIYFSDPFIARTFEKKIAGKKLVNDSKMAELVFYNTLKTVEENVFVAKTDKETDFLAGNQLYEIKWSDKSTPKKNTIVLDKKSYNPASQTYPLPVFTLHFLAKKHNSGKKTP